jgi:hypothetical protein
MLRSLYRLWIIVNGDTSWRARGVDDRMVWRRYDLASDRWETREMTPEEQAEAIAWWAIR